MNKKPKIMLSNFKNNWKIFSFYNLANVFQSGGTPSTKEPTFWGGTIPWIQSSDIQKDILFGVIPQKFISEDGLLNSSAKLISKNSIAIVTRVGVGKLAIIDQDYATSQDFLSLSDFNGDTQFIVYSIYRMLQKESTQLQGTSIKGITKEDLLSKKVSLPEIDEQSAIGSLFRTLDDLLASHKDNLSNYQSLKATMLSKMFPKAGQTVPEIRLDGFDGEWEKVKLKDVTESIEYGLNASAKEFDGENKYIRITDIDDVSRKFKEDSLTSPDIDVSECDNYLLCEKDILFARTGASVGKTYLYVKKDGKVYFAGFLIRARIKDKFDSKFIFQNTLTDRFTQYVKVTSQRSGQPGVNGKEYGEYELYLPNYEEQQAIGAYFSNLDNLINSYQEKISQLEILKKKLLQDMFI